MIHEIVDWIKQLESRPLIVGVQGIQGSGKSTLCKRLEMELDNCVCASLDDFYLPHDALEHTHHDFRLRGRGNPGTHDVALLEECIECVREKKPLTLPVYDKSANGGRGDRSQEKRMKRDTAIFIIEGWCLGFCPHNNGDIIDDHLKRYQHIFESLHAMVVLRADLKNLRRWRRQAEETMTLDDTHSFIDRFMPAYETYLDEFISNPKHTSLTFILDDQRNPVQTIRHNS